MEAKREIFLAYRFPFSATLSGPFQIQMRRANRQLDQQEHKLDEAHCGSQRHDEQDKKKKKGDRALDRIRTDT